MTKKIKLITTGFFIAGLCFNPALGKDFTTDFYPAHARKNYKNQKRIVRNINNNKLCRILKTNRKGELSLSSSINKTKLHFTVRDLKSILNSGEPADFKSCPQIVAKVKDVLAHSKVDTSKSKVEEVKK